MIESVQSTSFLGFVGQVDCFGRGRLHAVGQFISCDSSFELDFARFLDACPDILSFVKNSQSTAFRIEYQSADGGIANYYPDFIVKRTEAEIWIVETKGREDLDDPRKVRRR